MGQQEDMSEIRERLARLEEAVNNHIIHTLRQLDLRVWGILVLLLGTLLSVWLSK